jgi:hypothetical protein
MWFGCALLAFGCTMRRGEVWVVPGSSRDDLRFAIGESRGSDKPIDNLNFVRVSACGVSPSETRVGERVMWTAGGAAAPQALAGTFAYGRPPAGLRTERGPEPLLPGCYVVEISGAGISGADCFEIDERGTVRESADPVIECQVRDRAS